MGAIAQIKAKIGLDSTAFSAGLAGAAKDAENMRKTMDKLKTAIGAAFSTAAIGSFLKSIKATGDEINRIQQETGSTSSGFQSLKGVFLDNGLAAGNLESGLKKLHSAIIDLASGNAKAEDAFARLGIGLEDIRGKGTDEVFGMIAEAIANAEDKTDAISAAQDLLGKKLAGSLLPALKLVGEEGFANLSKRMEESGRVMDRAFLTQLNLAEGEIQAFVDRLKVAAVTIGQWFVAVGQGISSWWKHANLEGVDLLAEQMAGVSDWDAFLEGYEGFYDKQIDIRREAARRERQINADILQNAVETLHEEVDAVDEATKAEIKAREEAAKAAEREAKKAADARIKEEERALKGLADAQADYVRAWRKAEEDALEDVSPAERVKKLESAWRSLGDTIIRLQREVDAGGGVEVETELYRAKKMQLDVEGQLADARKAAADAEKETQDTLHTAVNLSIEDFGKLREIIGGLSDQELTDFSQKIQKLANDLKGLDFSGLAGLAALQNFRFPTITGGQMRQLARALADLANGLNGVQFPDFSALSALSGLDLPDFTSGQMRQLARALSALSDGLKGVTFPDLSPLATLAGLDLPNLTGDGVAEFAAALDKLATALDGIDADKAGIVADLLGAGSGMSGNLSIQLTAPDPEKLVLKVESGFADDLKSLATSAKTLADLKGVIYA